MKKNILIVGASTGIGQAVYSRLQALHNPITMGRAMVEASGSHHTCDVMADPLPDLDMPLHGLVYCPGSINLKPFRSLRDSDFQDDFNINVLGAVRVLRKYLENLQRSGSASVVLFSTVAVSRGMAFHASVASAKGAVEGLTRSLASELAPAIRVNAVAPSLTDTPLAAKLLRNDKQRDAATQRHPLKRIGTADDIASAVLYFLSEESSWITGQVLAVDGGLSTLS